MSHPNDHQYHHRYEPPSMMMMIGIEWPSIASVSSSTLMNHHHNHHNHHDNGGDGMYTYKGGGVCKGGMCGVRLQRVLYM